ncbi:hypothetical protein [Marinobacter sp.]|uniref:hypothetical protein n=1 Tax=Marinobacter sp. TaxID=50741 RepID=UPI001B582D95|nr:hypothetical protein [Marinobacter sp.]MBQ0834759.1 hypothetical protein [Marinobacter sp.]
MTKCAWSFMAAILLTASLPASGWDFDKTRARDIMDRAANDGDATARLLVAMALDERVDTIFDDYEFRLPPSKDPEQLYIRWLDHDHIYSSLMNGSGKHASKVSLMVYALKGTYALWNRRYGTAALYYRVAEQIGEELIQQNGFGPDLAALTYDARAGKVAAMRCSGNTPPQDTTYKIDKMLAGLERTSQIAKDYRTFIQYHSVGRPNTLGLEDSGCWSGALSGATVVYPLAPFNYEDNTSKYVGLVP